MGKFRVTWMLEIDDVENVDTPKQAAEEALRTMRDPEMIATEFEVELEDGTKEPIDLEGTVIGHLPMLLDAMEGIRDTIVDSLEAHGLPVTGMPLRVQRNVDYPKSYIVEVDCGYMDGGILKRYVDIRIELLYGPENDGVDDGYAVSVGFTAWGGEILTHVCPENYGNKLWSTDPDELFERLKLLDAPLDDEMAKAIREVIGEDPNEGDNDAS